MLQRRHRWLGWVLLLVTLAGLGAALMALALMFDPAPRVPPHAEVAPEDVARAVSLLREQDPRRAPEHAERVLTMTERDIDLLLNHGAQRLLGIPVDVTIERASATVSASVAVPGKRWLNFRARVVEKDALPVIDAVGVGQLPLPAWLVTRLVSIVLPRFDWGEQALATLALVRQVSFLPGQVQVRYAWDREVGRRMLTTLVPADEQLRLKAHHEALARLLSVRAPGSNIALGQLLAPLMALARERTRVGNDAAVENRAALLTLALYANQRSLAKVVPAAREWPELMPLRVRLSGREDFALHFLISALLAVDTTSPLSKAVGIYKELKDSRGGSGFSFDDIAADRAGTRLGELALAQPRALQERLARAGPYGIDDAALMPPWRDLPESMPEPEFKRRFGGVDAPEYRRMLAEIDRRVAALSLLR